MVQEKYHYKTVSNYQSVHHHNLCDCMLLRTWFHYTEESQVGSYAGDGALPILKELSAASQLIQQKNNTRRMYRQLQSILPSKLNHLDL
ncbi:hypothetical protein H5410_024536 [Solanum commersonii]|uniref:Uncharacterized protein n=1 Tax=Solanum commersonii TaxID=4109 RepID=A0A9J5ZMB1_SOLCO|nr:hypothetical protein H5410_024536 [Solanum commersonii]